MSRERACSIRRGLAVGMEGLLGLVLLAGAAAAMVRLTEGDDVQTGARGSIRLPVAENVHVPGATFGGYQRGLSGEGFLHLWMSRAAGIRGGADQVLWSPAEPDRTAALRATLQAFADSVPREAAQAAAGELVLHADENTPYAMLELVVRISMDSPTIRIWKFQVVVNRSGSDEIGLLGIMRANREEVRMHSPAVRRLGRVDHQEGASYYLLDGYPSRELGVVLETLSTVKEQGFPLRVRPEANVPWGAVVAMIDSCLETGVTYGDVDPQPRVLWADGVFDL